MAGRPRKTAAATPAAPERPNGKAKAPKVTVDFSALDAPETIEASEIRHTRVTTVDRSPVLGWLQDSWDTETGRRQTLPSDDQAEAFIKLLRAGVRRFEGMGLNVRKVAGDNGTVVVEYAAIEKRARKSTATK